LVAKPDRVHEAAFQPAAPRAGLALAVVSALSNSITAQSERGSKREEGPGVGPGLLKRRAWETRKVWDART
jgi:hypothetical protein